MKTAAQQITAIAYSDCQDTGLTNIPRSLDYRVKCDSYDDFKACLNLIGQYNDFNPERVISGSDYFFSTKAYYRQGNPNNGNDLFTFHIGRECSPAFYVSYNEFMAPLSSDDGTVNNSFLLTGKAFAAQCEVIKDLIGADAYSMETMEIDEGASYLTARFWFD